MSDGMGGYYAYSLNDDTDGFLGGPLALLVLLAGPLFTAFTFGEQLLLPTVLILLGFLLLYTPGSYNVTQSTLLVYGKAALSVPLFHYGSACLAYSLAKAGNTIVGTSGFLVLFTFLVRFVPLIAFVVVTRGFSALMLIGWPITYITASNESAQTATMALLHISLLLMPVIFIIGVIIAIRKHDKSGIYLLPKLIAFALGSIPLATVALLSDSDVLLVIAATLVLYPLLYFIYCCVIKQPSIFADWLLYPFLLSLAGFVIVHLDSTFVLPSDVFSQVYHALVPVGNLFEPALRICDAFATSLGNTLYGFFSWFFSVIPEFNGTHIDPVVIPPFVGALVSVTMVCLISYFVSRLASKRMKT